MSISEIHGEMTPGAFTRHPIESNGTSYVFDTNFPVGLIEPDGPNEKLIANQTGVYEALEARGYGFIPNAPSVSNTGAFLDGMLPFYRRHDLAPDYLDTLYSELARMHPDAFSGWDGEEPVPETACLLSDTEVDSLVLSAIERIT